MPTRILRDGILDSESVNALSEQAEIFYRRLMSLVDDYGRFEANPAVLRARLFSLQYDRWPIERIVNALTELNKTVGPDGVIPLVILYSSNNKNYLEISNFQQRIRKDSKYPPPSAREAIVVLRQSAADGGGLRRTAADGGEPRPTRAQGRTESESESYAEAETETHTEAETRTGIVRVIASKPKAADLDGPTSPRFDEFWAMYPRKAHKDQACGAWVSYVTAASEGAVFAALARYLASDEVKRNVVMNPENWLKSQYGDRWNGEWPRAPTASSPGSVPAPNMYPDGDAWKREEWTKR